jgi:hypothetical protein
MGSSQSYVSPELALSAAVVASAIGIGYTQITRGSTSAAPAGSPPAGKKSKKQKSIDALSLHSTPASVENKSRLEPAVIPGGFDTPTVSTPTPVPAEPPKTKKSKKKKKTKSSATSTAAAAALPDAPSSAGYHSDSSFEQSQPKAKRSQKLPSSPSQLPRSPVLQSTISIETDGSWTRVGSARRKQRAGAGAGPASASEGPSGPSADPSGPSADPTTSDAGVTTSLTGNSSPVAGRTDDEGAMHSSRDTQAKRPLAERMLPKSRKTGVEELRCISHLHIFLPQKK